MPPGTLRPYRVAVVATTFSHGFDRTLAERMKEGWREIGWGGEGQVGHFGDPHSFVLAGDATLMQPVSALENPGAYGRELRQHAASSRGPEWSRPAKVRPSPNPQGTMDGALEALVYVADFLAASGLFDEARIAEDIDDVIACELGEEYPELREEFLERTRRQLEARSVEEARWTGLTMNDRIERAFRDLEANGILVGEDVGGSLQEGEYLMAERAQARPGARGYVFYHRQDLEAAVRGEGLFFGYGVLDRDGAAPDEGDDDSRADEDESRVRATAVGATLAKALRRHAVPTEWNGSGNTRVMVLPFRWQKRRTTRAPDIESRVAPAPPPFPVDADGRCVACSGKGWKLWKLVTSGGLAEACSACKGKGRSRRVDA
jgi:hypothetical protein